MGDEEEEEGEGEGRKGEFNRIDRNGVCYYLYLYYYG